MFTWNATRRESGKNDRTRQNARAFRPGTDRLEAREVLSTFTVPGTLRSVSIPGLTTNAFNSPALNAAYNPSPSLATVRNGFNVGNVGSARIALPNTAVVNNPTGANLSTLAASLNNRSATSSALRTTTAGTTLNNTTKGIPRPAGGFASINPRFNFSGRNTAGTAVSYTSSNNPALTNSSAVDTGLAFTNGLGFSDFNNRFSGTNAANTGLAFLNGQGSAIPTGLNTVASGLGFTGGLGYAAPARSVAASNNAATSGLAFTNGLGGSLPGALSPYNNSINSGLAFTNGLGFANQSTNPFSNFSINASPFSVTNLNRTFGSSIINTNSGLSNGGALVINSGTGLGGNSFMY